MAVLNEHALYRPIDSHRVSISSFTAFEHYGIIVDIHEAAIDQKVMTFVDIDGIRARRLDILCRSIDVTTEETYMVTVVKMIVPERAIDLSYILNCDVAGVADIDEAGSLRLLVRTLRVPLSADPKLVPVVVAIAINSALARDGEAIDMVSIDECREILAGLALDTCLYNLEVGDAVRASENGAVLKMQMSTQFKEK
jgi:hypothetical protein